MLWSWTVRRNGSTLRIIHLAQGPNISLYRFVALEIIYNLPSHQTGFASLLKE